MPSPTLRQLDIFAQIVDRGSMEGCAAAMDIDPALVEAEIAQLEDRLGHRLFHSAEGVTVLTPAGRRTLEALRALASLANADRAEKSPPPPPGPAPAGRRIVLATHPSIFSHFQDALEGFEKANPDIAIALDLDSFTGPEVAEELTSDRADIGFFYALGEVAETPSDYVWTERLSLFVGEGHGLAALEAVAAPQLMNVPPIMLGRDNRLRPLIDEALAWAGLDLTPPALESDDYRQILVDVRAGKGFFCMFGPVARDFGQMEGIRRLPFIDPLPPVEVRRAINPVLGDDPLLLALVAALV